MDASVDERNTFSAEEYDEEFEEIEIEEEVDEEEEEEEEVGAGEAHEHGVVSKVDSGAGHQVNRSANVGGSTDSEGKIFVGGVAWETTEEVFNKHFEKYGEIIDSIIMKDRNTGKPRGFGFVTYNDPSVLDEVLKHEHVIDGRTVEVKRTVPRVTAITKPGGPKTKKIFIGGIPPTLTEDEFKEYFEVYGKVSEHQIMLDHSTGRSRGFGFITFEKEATVDEIMADTRIHELGGKQVELKKAVPKNTGGDLSSSSHGGGNMYGGYGNLPSYGYGAAAYQSGSVFGARAASGFYGRGNYGYVDGGSYGYGMGYGSTYGGPMYGYGAGYGGQSGYNAFYGNGGGGGAAGGGNGRYGRRYNPYGR
ncbi:hypothetical protein ZOSMA_339G00100 [Zostera marina]|uniref:RRM domain-containing protein n=1 Tax=Zostera marina TaxID=29655 RepID=A0A0K9P828_ZOSMR|nr:hypothetical protein ZOSMA_339G00100 [Zostera marina]